MLSEEELVASAKAGGWELVRRDTDAIMFKRQWTYLKFSLVPPNMVWVLLKAIKAVKPEPSDLNLLLPPVHFEA